MLLLPGTSARAILRQAPSPATGANTIKLLTLNQPPCATPSAKAVLVAKVAYHLTEQEKSAYGYSVSIKFQSTDRRRTFSEGRMGHVAATKATDTLVIRYPLAAVWSRPDLKRPITCYFYLHRNAAQGRSLVIASTPAVVFTECQ
ncbi:hypothetical protein B0919_20660 [Hymenobacter sp. CRA2]|nr:hypothetical protein B0919_20660 [Hymenobacter sp. CRA2]